MRLPFRQGLVQYPANCLQKINNDVVITTINGPIVATISNRVAEYYHTEPQSIDPYVAWTGLVAGIDYWLYIDINKITAERTFGQTLVAPIDDNVAPSNPVVNQHWFDTNTMTMKVWSGSAWGEYIRVFFAQISGTNSFTYNLLGTQAGIATSYNSGRILFDGFGKVIKQSNNSFMTTEDQFFVDGSSIQSARLESTVIAATADENIPAFSVVTYSTFNAIKLARYEDISTAIVAIVTDDVMYGAVTNVIMQGIVINPSWNWPSVNAPLWVDTFGQLTNVDPNTVNSLRPKAVPIARVIARDAIMFDQGMGGVGAQGPAGNATANVPVASTVVTGTVKLATAPTITNSPVVIGDNDPRLTNARPPISHTHPATDVSYIGHGGLASGTAQTAIDNLEDRKFNLDGGILTGPLTLAADPTTTLQAATKQYVDSRVSGLIWINTICLVNLISDSLNTPPITPAYSDVYIVATGGMGAWSGLSGRMVQWNGTSWNNLGDFSTTFGSTNRRLGISMESTTAASGTFAGKDNQIAIWTASTQTWSFYTPVNNNAVYVCNEASLHKYHQYVYDSASGSWLEFGGPQAIQPGNHLALIGNILSVVDGIGSTLNADMLDGQHASAFSLITHDHDTAYVKLSGSSMTGLLTLAVNPTAALHATTKQYVDGQNLTRVNKAGDVMTGLLTLSSNPTDALHATTKQYVDAHINDSDVHLTPSQNAALDALIATATELNMLVGVTSLIQSQLNYKVNRTGDTMTGILVLSGAPTAPLHAATKQYVDNHINDAIAHVASAEHLLITQLVGVTSPVQTQINGLQNQVTSLDTQLNGGPTTLSSLQADVNSLTSTTNSLQTQINGMNSIPGDVATLQSQVGILQTDVAANTAAISGKVSKSGDTMTGTLTLTGNAGINLAGSINLVGLSSSVHLYSNGTPITLTNTGIDVTNGILNTDSNIKVTNAQIILNNGTTNNVIIDATTGDMVTTAGTVTVSHNPTTDFQVATKQYVDTAVTAQAATLTHYVHIQAVTSNSWTVIHNLNTTNIAFNVYVLTTANPITGLKPIFPQDVSFVDNNTMTIAFSTSQTGKVVIIGTP